MLISKNIPISDNLDLVNYSMIHLPAKFYVLFIGDKLVDVLNRVHLLKIPDGILEVDVMKRCQTVIQCILYRKKRWNKKIIEMSTKDIVDFN